MARSPRIISLSLGSQTIRLAEFRSRPEGGLILEGYSFREVLLDPANERIDQAELDSLRQLVIELQTKHDDVNYTIAPQSVFARFVKLPVIEEEKIERIIAFEAQQNVPFPIDEVVWDYQLIGGGGDKQVQIVLVAIKSDLLDEINSTVEDTGLRTGTVDVATMALYNAFRYNYAELAGCTLLVDIGARTTNLLFAEGQKIFTRSIPIGGGSITTTIAKEFNEPFAAAEFRKKRDGFVSPGDAYVEPTNPEVSRVSRLIRSTMIRLQAEIMRSISHYRAQQEGSIPERVFLCGGGASTPYMREFFREKLKAPIELFNPLRNVMVSASAPLNHVARSAHLVGELVGLALRSVTVCPIELNLRPASVVRRQELEKRRPFLVLAGAALVLALLAWDAYYTRAAQVARASAEEIRKINAPMQTTEAKIEKLRKQASALDAIAMPLTAAINDRVFWIQIIEDLNARLPKEDIWITELIPLSAGKAVGVDEKRASELGQTTLPAPLQPRSKMKSQTAVIDGLLLRGLYLFNPKQEEVVVDYFRNLVGSPFFNVDPNNQGRVIKSTIPNNNEWAFPYELHLDLKKPLKLQ
jgi:type IV pilus assembly protein PilM